MARPMYKDLGPVGYDELIYNIDQTPDAVTVKIAASQGQLKRGAVLVGEAGAEVSHCSKVLGATDVVYILAEDTDATAATNATAYRTGHFCRDGINTKSYQLTAADEEHMRKEGIILSDALEG